MEKKELQEMEQDLAELMRGWSLREVMSRYEGQEVRIPYKELVPFQEIINTSGGIWFKRTKQEREERIRKEALALWESDREEEKLICFDLVSGENCYDFTDSELFEEACIERNEFATELLTAGLTEDTKAYIRTETAGFTDSQILTMFDLETNGHYWNLDGIRYSLLIGIYIARRSEELREGILSMFRKSIRHDLASRYAMKSPEDYDLAYKKFSIPDEILQERAEYKLSEHEEYDLFREVKHYLTLRMEELAGSTEDVDIKKLSVHYPDYFEVGNGRFNRILRKNKLDDFLIDEEFEVKTSEESKERDGLFRFSISEPTIEDNPLYSKDEREEDRQYYLNKKKKLNEKYKDLNDRTPFFDDVINAVGACMTSCNTNVLTIRMIYKFMQADKSANITPEIGEDIEKALYLGKELSVKISGIRGAKDVTIEENVLSFRKGKFNFNGQITTGYEFFYKPAFYRYNMINKDMTKIRMLKESPKSKKNKPDARLIYVFLEKWVDRYKSHEFVEYGYDNVIKEAGIREDIDSSTQVAKNRRSRLLTYVDNALEELKASGLIKDYEKRIETEESKLKSSQRKYYKFRITFKGSEKDKQVKKKTRRKS